MSFVKTQDGTELFLNDWGPKSGKTVILIHGWPLDADMWSDQALFLAENGCRVIAYDRRGFGRSQQPWSGYDYDTLAGDLADIIDTLDLRAVTLAGFSMGGGEVARYLGRFGPGKVAKAILVSAVTPYLLKTPDNESGVDQAVFDAILQGLADDRPKFLAGFGEKFYGNSLLTKNVSAETLRWSQQIALLASLRATIECAKAFATTDFRLDMAAFTVPTLVIHGTADATVPIDSSARVAVKLMKNPTVIEYEGEPHGLHATARDRLNQDLLAFINR